MFLVRLGFTSRFADDSNRFNLEPIPWIFVDVYLRLRAVALATIARGKVFPLHWITPISFRSSLSFSRLLWDSEYVERVPMRVSADPHYAF